ncbi:hypothetical protein [Vibrio sp. R78045]|uniref:hypothetical protein n=1 Tax=Vibrio sp. R78045 TaxID=3093868 RepID=UPI0036F4106C
MNELSESFDGVVKMTDHRFTDKFNSDLPEFELVIESFGSGDAAMKPSSIWTNFDLNSTT